MKHQKMNRILAAALSAACLVPFAAMVPVDADAADVMSALEITQEMGLGFNIGNSLDSTGYGNYDDITSFEKSYGNPAVTKEMEIQRFMLILITTATLLTGCVTVPTYV